jgi:hypothetical protein
MHIIIASLWAETLLADLIDLSLLGLFDKMQTLR